VREADPVNNVELRRGQNGQELVVFAFPYRADIVDAVRSIPGRRFDWQAKEWWAPRADATAPYVQGVLERFPELEVAPEVGEWLSRAVKGWVGRVTAARRAGAGWFVLDGIAGDLPDELAALAAGCRSPRRSPTRCWSCRARAWISARCAARPSSRSAWSPHRRR
jgi:SWI/SNF-related matrix-associated actin-dependent regulator of chromatin subfamily A-like protein 1